MRSIIKSCICLGLLLCLAPVVCPLAAQTPTLFQGEINDNNINVRSDSTVSSRVICAVNKGEPVEVVRELYEWYKIRLPKTAPSFIKKDLVMLIDAKTAQVAKENVNIRLAANESSPIVGKTSRNEVITILGENAGWYRIEPLSDSYGWVHKRFVNKAGTIKREEEPGLTAKINKEDKLTAAKAPVDGNLTIEGIIKPYGKVIKRVATHKLLAPDKKIYLLKGNKESLDSLNYRKVRITGKPIPSKDPKYTSIEVIKIEAID